MALERRLARHCRINCKTMGERAVPNWPIAPVLAQ